MFSPNEKRLLLGSALVIFSIVALKLGFFLYSLRFEALGLVGIGAGSAILFEIAKEYLHDQRNS